MGRVGHASCARGMLGANAIPNDNTSPATCLIIFSFRRVTAASSMTVGGAQRPSVARQRGGSAAMRRAPALELLACLRPRRIDAEDRAPLRHLLLYEILERRLLERLLRHLLRDVLGDHRNALVVAHHDVAGIDRH